jgi:prepilin-type N-terminal cleavage/methylation domain-containing protein
MPLSGSSTTRKQGASPARAAFTMTELMIVITIIAILIALLIPALNMLRRSQKKVETRGLMDHISLALLQVLETNPILGSIHDAGSSDFVDSPWTWLSRNYVAAGKEPPMTLTGKYLAVGPAAGPWGPGGASDSDQILDAFTMADRSNHFIWAIVNGKGSGSATYNYTDQIWIRSTVGTPDNPRDDLILRYRTKEGQWTPMKYDDAMNDPGLPASFGF